MKNHSQSWSDRLRSGKFVVTTEVSPPLSTATGKLKRDIEMVKELVAASQLHRQCVGQSAHVQHGMQQNCS